MSTRIIKNSNVYCDANFLIAYGANKTKQPEIQKRAQILFAQLLIKECKLYVSPLTFDEAWLGIKRELGPKKIKDRARFMVSKLLGRMGLRLTNYGASEFSYFEIFDDLNSFTNKMFNYRNFSVIQLPNAKEGVIAALTYLKSFKLKPRDSFHLATIKANDIIYVISNDSDFINRQEKIGLKVIQF